MHVLLSGAGTGGQHRWGDYLRVRPYADVDMGIWVGSGYVYATPSSKEISYFIFGREVHAPRIQNFELLPPVSTSSRIALTMHP